MGRVPAVLIPRIMVALAALLALALTHRVPAHRPVAVALAGALLLDLLRATTSLEPRIDLALYLLTPALAAWCALRVLCGACPYRAPMVVGAVWWIAALAVLRAPDPASWWASVPRWGHEAVLLIEAAAAISWWASPRRATCPEICAIILIAGDVVALLGPVGFIEGPWWIVAWQAALIAAALMVVQVDALQSARKKSYDRT